MELRLVKTPDQEMSFCSFNVTIQVSLEGHRPSRSVCDEIAQARHCWHLAQVSWPSIFTSAMGDLRLDERGVLGTLDALPESCDPLGSGSVRPR